MALPTQNISYSFYKEEKPPKTLKFVKFIRRFLLILIIIGVTLLLTQNLWLIPLTDAILYLEGWTPPENTLILDEPNTTPVETPSTTNSTNVNTIVSTSTAPVKPKPIPVPKPVQNQVPNNSSQVCDKVITRAKNLQTGEIKEFPTPCDVPSDWYLLFNENDNGQSTTTATTTNTNQ